MIAEFETDLARARTREGLAVAKAKGRLRGKPPKLKPTQEAHLVKLWHGGEHTTLELAELFSVSRATVYRAIQRGSDGWHSHGLGNTAAEWDRHGVQDERTNRRGMPPGGMSDNLPFCQRWLANVHFLPATAGSSVVLRRIDPH